jgi:hypothetical protein
LIRPWWLACLVAISGCQCAPTALIALEEPDPSSAATLAATLRPTEWRLGIRCQEKTP